MKVLVETGGIIQHYFLTVKFYRNTILTNPAISGSGAKFHWYILRPKGSIMENTDLRYDG
jgi:hypothetical protein